MRVKALLPILGTAAAYALLRGWPPAVPPLLRACAAVLVLVAAIGLWAMKRRASSPEGEAKGRRKAAWTDYLAVIAAVLAVESAFLWLLTATPAPLEKAADAIRERLRPGSTQAPVTSAGARQSGNWLWTDETRRPLPRRTNFTPGNRPEVFIRLRDTGDAAELTRGPVYVRAFALGRYDRAAWAAYPGLPEALEADAAGYVQLKDRPGRAIVHEVFHAADPLGQNAMTAIHGAVAVNVPGLTRLDAGLHLLPPPRSDGGYNYVAASKPLKIEDLQDDPDIRPQPDAPPALLALPEQGGAAPRLRNLANIAAGEGTLVRRLRSIQSHLRSTLVYSLETTNARDLDPIENFLFHEHRGHCEYFATAGALLARSIGVPARAAYGWAGGTYYESSNMIVFRASEAHAWTEVWLDGHGWVVLDPTPPAAIGGSQPRAARPDEAPPTAGMETPDDTDAHESNAPRSEPSRVALWLLAGSGVPALVLLLWRGRRRATGRESSRDGNPGRPDPGYLQAWRRASASRGMPMPKGMTLRKHLKRLGVTPPFADELLRYHYGTTYEKKPGDAELEKRLIAEIRAWAAQDGSSNPAR